MHTVFNNFWTVIIEQKWQNLYPLLPNSIAWWLWRLFLVESLTNIAFSDWFLNFWFLALLSGAFSMSNITSFCTKWTQKWSHKKECTFYYMYSWFLTNEYVSVCKVIVLNSFESKKRLKITVHRSKSEPLYRVQKLKTYFSQRCIRLLNIIIDLTQI